MVDQVKINDSTALDEVTVPAYQPVDEQGRISQQPPLLVKPRSNDEFSGESPAISLILLGFHTFFI
jgi:hypothetical protein